MGLPSTTNQKDTLGMANDYTHFWRNLLEFGDTEEHRRRNWNVYCIWRFNIISYPFVATENLKETQEKFNVVGFGGQETSALENFSNISGGPQALPDGSGVALESFMDFSNVEFDDDVSFAGRILIGADFRNTNFERNANFSDTEFLGITSFEGAKFRCANTGLWDGTSFNRSTFHNTVRFNSTEFGFKTRFDGATFHSGVYFRDAKFNPEAYRGRVPSGYVSFAGCRFDGDTDFACAAFEYGVDFAEVKFRDSVKFDGTIFRNIARFSNAKFQDTTSFRGATFGKPPRFFETELHEDVDFGQVDWKEAEQSYWRSKRRGDRLGSIENDADDAVRAWDRLALIMSQREKLPERHEFFRLKMRAQRQSDGRSLLSLTNLLFEALSDYGWSIGRAFSCWIGHIVLGTFGLVLTLAVYPACDRWNFWQAIWDGALVSFANAHAILGLASEGGYLHSARKNLYDAANAHFVLDAIGTLQAVLGPIFLFLVLLTLRNRFRIG